MPPSNKNAKKSAPKNKKVAKTAPKTEPKVEPVQETPVQETPVQETPVAPVSTEAPVVNETPYLDEFTSVVSELDKALTTIRDLKTRLQKLEKQVHRDTRALNKKASGKRPRKPRDPNAPKSGFAKEGPVSDEMRKFLGLKQDELIS